MASWVSGQALGNFLIDGGVMSVLRCGQLLVTSLMGSREKCGVTEKFLWLLAQSPSSSTGFC